MTDSKHGEGILNFYQKITAIQQIIIDTQTDAMLCAATAMANAVARQGRIFVFGTGHSHMMAEEAFFRAGGIAAATPVFSSVLMLHEHPDFASRVERTPGLAAVLLDQYKPDAGEVIIIFSNSGVNQLPVEMALEAKKRDLTVVGICSMAYAHQAPLSSLGQRLDQVADISIDNCGEPGDALLPLAGVPWKVCASSTITGAMIWQCLLAETCGLLLEQGIEPPAIISYNLPGAMEHNTAVLKTWQPKNRHL